MKVVIYSDETYMRFVDRYEPDGTPAYWTPIEIPGELFDEYEAAWGAFIEVRNRIVTTYGESEPNPNIWEEREAWLAKHDDEPPTASDLESAWAEYEQSTTPSTKDQ